MRVANARTFGINFFIRKEEYVTCWFRSAEPAVTRDQLRLEVGDFGVPALYVKPDEEGLWLANFRLPLGLPAGWSPVRLRFADSAFGETTLRIAVDLPVRAERLEVKTVCDGVNWRRDEIDISLGGYLSCWVSGLPENSDLANVSVFLDEVKLPVPYVGETDAGGTRQVNAILPAGTIKGEHALRVECAGVSAEVRTLSVA
jgi:hypothetical protein